MPKIPLQKFAAQQYPCTPKSTINFWAKLAYLKRQGPLAGRIERIEGRWYVNLPGDPITEKIISEVKSLLGRKG